MSTQLEPSETESLAQLETRIEKGLGSFIDVGEALSTIRDGKLYRATHGTFEDYCRERWKMSRGYAYRLITAVETIAMLPAGNKSEITHESQARELSKVEPAKRAAVIKRVRKATGGKVTAAAIREVVTPVPVTNDTKTLSEWVRAHADGMPIEEIARSYKVTEADVRGALQLPEAKPEEKPAAWSLPRWGDKLRAYLTSLVEAVPAEHRAEAKWFAGKIAAEVFAPTDDDAKPEPFGDRRVIPPQPEWVTAYSASIGYAMDGQKWCDSYATKGWTVGKTKMKDWQAACRTWKTNGYGVGTITLTARRPDKVTDYSRI